MMKIENHLQGFKAETLRELIYDMHEFIEDNTYIHFNIYDLKIQREFLGYNFDTPVFVALLFYKREVEE